MTPERARELDEMFPGGWGVAPARADADKLYAGGVTAVRPGGEVWSDDGHPADGEEFTGEPLDPEDTGPRPGELAKPHETRVYD